MYCIYLLLQIVASLSSTTNCVVYYVAPDNHYQDTNNDVNILQHYLNESEKYFTSNTQLIFLPGKHHLLTDLVIQDVQNLTLQGINQNNNTIIYCTKSVHVFINSSDNITFESISVNKCGVSQENDLLAPLAALKIFNCSNIALLDSLFICQYQQCGLVVANVVGQNALINIASSHLLITHNMTRSTSTTEIINYNHMGDASYQRRAIEILFYEHLQLITLYIFQIKLYIDKAMNISSTTSNGANMVYIEKMELIGITVTENVIAVMIINNNTLQNIPYANMIRFQDCSFSKINGNQDTR